MKGGRGNEARVGLNSERDVTGQYCFFLFSSPCVVQIKLHAITIYVNWKLHSR